MRDGARYPYTYAYDWVREAGLAGSRADASRRCDDEASRRGVDKEYLCRILAEQYVSYYETIKITDVVKHEALERLRGGY